MEVKAITKSIRMSPRKVRLVADAIRNMPVEKAYRVLEVTQKRAALVVSKTLKSAVANAITNASLDAKNLYVSQVMVNESQALKRFRPSTRGRIHPYKKRGSHLTIVLNEKVVSAVAKSAVAKTSSERADEAVAQALHGGKEEKKSGVKALAARLTGRNKAEKTASVKTTAVKEGGKK